jgi:hypothetical protein
VGNFVWLYILIFVFLKNRHHHLQGLGLFTSSDLRIRRINPSVPLVTDFFRVSLRDGREIALSELE